MCKLEFNPLIDLLATRLNTQLERFVSWQPDPMAWKIDALLQNWKELQGYAFPTFVLIPKCLHKIQEESATVVLIAPLWPTQPWYPQLLRLAIASPALLPSALYMTVLCYFILSHPVL